MNYNLITAIIAIAAIVSPIIVSVINNRYSLEKYDREVTEQRKYKEQERINIMIDDYLVSTAELTVGDSINTNTLTNYKKKYFALLPYTITSAESVMKEIDKLVESKIYGPINEKLYFVAILMNSEIVNE